jgi:hypothetical protein
MTYTSERKTTPSLTFTGADYIRNEKTIKHSPSRDKELSENDQQLSSSFSTSSNARHYEDLYLTQDDFEIPKTETKRSLVPYNNIDQYQFD